VDGLKIVNGKLYFSNDNAFEMEGKDWTAQGIAFDDDAGSPILSADVSHYTEKLDPDSDNNQYGDYSRINDIKGLQKSDTYNSVPEERDSGWLKCSLTRLQALCLKKPSDPCM
jgi:hypothetical protein